MYTCMYVFVLGDAHACVWRLKADVPTTVTLPPYLL